MSIEIKYVLQIMSFGLVILFFVLVTLSAKVHSKVKKLPQELGLEYEKERAKLRKKTIFSPKVQIAVSVIIIIYLLFSLMMPNTVKNLVGGDDNYSLISFLITLIVVLPLGTSSYKNVKEWNKFKKEKQLK